MQNIDWPLAIILAIAFVVMSIVRWRYFQSRARRRARRDDAPTSSDRGDRTDTTNGVEPPPP